MEESGGNEETEEVSIMSARVNILSAVGFVILLLLSLEGIALSQSIPFKTIEKGEISYFSYGDANFLGGDLVIKDKKTWEWFWEQHAQGKDPAPPLPKIDFHRETVLIAMLGYQPSGGGPSIEIVSITPIWNTGHKKIPVVGNNWFTKGISVLVKEDREPGPLDVITNPFHIVTVRGTYASVAFGHQLTGEAGSCRDNSDCDTSAYCEKGIGRCDQAGVCVAKPEACTTLYDPVCGCDGATYSNVCHAAMNGISVSHRGPCK